MKGDLKKLAEFLEDLTKEVSLVSSEASKIYCIELIKALAKFSPVDTSQLISNWVVVINAKQQGTLPAHHKGEKGSTANLSRLKTITDALNVIKNIKQGDRVYISNTSPQVIYTNYGTTKQEPQYYIERAMQLAEKSVNLNNLNVRLDKRL